MTRRGSIAYYLASVVVGSFFVTVFVSAGDYIRKVPLDIGFFELYVASLVVGSFTLLLSALLLRYLATWFEWSAIWQWFLLGGATTFGVAVLLLVLAEQAHRITWGFMYLTMGPVLAWDRAPWAIFPAGAATAIVLRRIHLAFEPTK